MLVSRTPKIEYMPWGFISGILSQWKNLQSCFCLQLHSKSHMLCNFRYLLSLWAGFPDQHASNLNNISLQSSTVRINVEGR